MNASSLKVYILIIILLLPMLGSAFETDQFNLPTQSLADIGDEVSAYTQENIVQALAKLNGELSKLQHCADGGEKCWAKDSKRLEYLRSEEAVNREVFKMLGDGIIPFTRSGTYMNEHRFIDQPARYKTGYSDSIFRLVPTNYFTISPTVKLYGSQFGTDKIAHFFQQGYTYYKIREKALAKGASIAEAEKKAVRWGKRSEHTYFGTLVGGVFSNADLFANYAGMKFYEGLTKSIELRNVSRPAIVVLENGLWKINKAIDLNEVLIKPFMTDHMNEALNPSIYVVGLRSSIRKTVRKKSCRQWRQLYPNVSQAEFDARTETLRTWQGEDYGYVFSKKFVTIANTCF